MSTARKVFLERHPVLSYFVLACAISWIAVLMVVGGPAGLPGEPGRFNALIAWVVLAQLAGPSIAGLLMTGLLEGRAGLRELLSQMLRWRVGARWYAVAFLTAPLATVATLFALSRSSPTFLPGVVTAEDKISHLLSGLAAGLAAGFFEELGWTGFAVPRLGLRHRLAATGIIVGVVWGVWHLVVVWWGSSDSSGGLPLALLLPGLLFSFLPPFRMLMVWVYDRTGSLLLAMIMHASLTASVRIFDPLGISGAPLVTYNVVLGAALWVVVAAVALAHHGSLERRALRRHAA